VFAFVAASHVIVILFFGWLAAGGDIAGFWRRIAPRRASHQSLVRCAKRLDAPQQLPYLGRRDTSPQREACYLEG
jgi:hypothetical protein